MSQERLSLLEARYQELISKPPADPWSQNYEYASWYCRAKAKLEEEIIGSRYSVQAAVPVEHGKFKTLKVQEPNPKARKWDRDYMAQKKRESRARAGCKDCGQPTQPKRIRCEACQDKKEVEIRANKNAASRFRRLKRRTAA